MGNPRTKRKRKPTFLWQALLIVCPVAVLAVFGFLSLRQDRLLAQREAAERAQTIADELVPKIWAELTTISNSALAQPRTGEDSPRVIVQRERDDTDARTEHWLQLSRPAFQVDQAGNLIFPPPYSPIPNPHPLNPTDLNEQQIQQWTAAQTAEWQDASTAVTLYKNFLATNPPPDFAPIALYRLGLLLDQQHEPNAAVDAFEDILVKYPSTISEAGLPLDAFAKLKLLQLTQSGTTHAHSAWSPSPDDLCSNLIYQPSFLTPRLLAEMSGYLPKEKLQNWQSVWDKHETARALYTSARSHISDGAGAPSQRVERGQGEQGGNQNAPPGFNSLSPVEGERGPIFSAAPQLFWFTTAQPLKVSLTSQTKTSTNGPASELTDHSWLALRFRDEWEQPRPGLRSGFDQPRTRYNNIFDVKVTEPTLDLESSYWYICRSQSEMAAELNNLVNHSVHLPAYFGLEVNIAGKRVAFNGSDLRTWRDVHYNGKGSGERKEFSNDLATTILASANKTEAGADLLKISIYLTSPATLYKLQTARTFWFGSLILFSALAALLGLLAAWRSFQRQLQLSEMKSNFVASVSHELRAPIASVRLMAESLERGKISEPAKQNEYFRFIGQESRRLSSLIENVLDFSRIEQGRKQYEFEPTDLVALAQRTVKIMEPYAAERQIALELKNNLQPATCNLQPNLDGRAIQQALVNLLDNAIKHSRAGQTVTVGLEAVFSVQSSVSSSEQGKSSIQDPASSIEYPASTNPSSAPPESSIQNPASENPSTDTRHPTLVTLFVEDQGEGIPAAEHTKIFERFYRLGSELRRETQGVGIGLSIVKHIVEAHGGRVIVRSAPGQGSRFTIELPVNPENNH